MAAALAVVGDCDSAGSAASAEQPAKTKAIRRKVLCQINIARAFTKWSDLLIAR
jgi:hypothetical protein